MLITKYKTKGLTITNSFELRQMPWMHLCQWYRRGTLISSFCHMVPVGTEPSRYSSVVPPGSYRPKTACNRHAKSYL